MLDADAVFHDRAWLSGPATIAQLHANPFDSAYARVRFVGENGRLETATMRLANPASDTSWRLDLGTLTGGHRLPSGLDGPSTSS